MCKKFFLVCITLLSALPCFATLAKVSGRITDINGKPVDRCLVKAAATSYATYSNAKGDYSLEYDTDSAHSLIVVCMGYDTKEVAIDAEAGWIILKHTVNTLKDVAIVTEHYEGKMTKGVLGKKNLKPYGRCSGKPGMETAVFLPAANGLLNEVFFYITKDGIPKSKFRVHIYGMDTAHQPGEDLLDSIVVLHANEGDEWVSADLSSRRIAVSNGVLISMEWIAGSGNYPWLTDDVKKGYKEELKNYDGQVLAFTKGYKKRLRNAIHAVTVKVNGMGTL